MKRLLELGNQIFKFTLFPEYLGQRPRGIPLIRNKSFTVGQYPVNPKLPGLTG